MEESLEEALDKVFGKSQESKPEGGVETPEGETPPIQDSTLEELIQKANELFNKAEEAQRKGDWAEYGRYQKELENILKELSKLSGIDIVEE